MPQPSSGVPADAKEDAQIAADLALVAGMPAASQILNIVCGVTGMGLAAIVYVSAKRWVACAVRDDIHFGLKPGDELDIATTLCRETRDSGQPIAFDQAATDAVYCGHPTPARYGFQSYIDVPIFRDGKRFFGTLLAFDRRPAKVNNPQVLGMFRQFADLIGLQLDAADRGAAARMSADERDRAANRRDAAADRRQREADARDAKSDERQRTLLGERSAMHAAAARHSQLRAVIESARDYAVVTVDLDGQIVGWSAGAEATFGRPAADAVGQPFAAIFTPEDRANGVPTAELKKAETVGVSEDNRWHMRGDGQRVFVIGATRPILGDDRRLVGFVKVCRDETERHSVAESLARAAAIVESSDDAIISKSLDSIIHSWNSGAERLFGFTAAEAIGQSITIIIPPDRLDEEPRILDQLRAGRRIDHFQTVRQRKDGRLVDVSVTISPIRDAEGRITGASKIARDITTQRQSDAAVQRLTEQRRLALDAADLGWWTMDPASGDVIWDEGYKRVFGVEGDRLEYGQVIELLHPDDRDRVDAAVRAATRADDPQRFAIEYRVIHPDKSVHWVRARGQAYYSGEGADRRYTSFVGTVQDITADREASESLREMAAQIEQQSRLFEQIATATLDFIYVFARDGRVLYANRRLLEVWGRTAGQTIGKQLIELGYPQWHADMHLREIAQVIETKQPIFGKVPFTGGSGISGVYEYIFTPVLDREGNVTVIAGTTRDITEREALLAAEQAARGEAERQSRVKDEFLATLSHELRTPLNAIMGWVQLLKRNSDDPTELQEGLGVIERNARAQTQIIEDILDMSRIVAGKLRLDVQRVDLAALVRAGVETVQPGADAKGVRIQSMLDPAAGPVSGDPNRLHQVFWNLLSNAVKFTPKGGRVQVLLERVNSHVEATITDTGDGIEPAFLGHVFERFRQADASTTRKHGGLGLGLSIVKQLVELHGGSVRVKSPGRGQGATFVVSLPLTIVHADPATPEPVREHPAAEVQGEALDNACGQLEGLRIIAVDDEPDGRQVVQRLLGDCGAIVRTAGSADEAMKLLAEEVPDVLISDIGMPGEDGYALIRRVRARSPERGGNTRAIALTAYARAADRVRAMEAGFQMHLAKPVEPAELIVTVATLAKLG